MQYEIYIDSLFLLNLGLKENNYPIKVVFCVFNDFDSKLYMEAFDELEII